MWADIQAAFSFLTIIPLGYAEGRKPGWSFSWYPLVGIMIGGLLMGIAQVSPFDADITAFLVLLAWVIITGGLHLDGFGDSCDGLFATVSVERRLEIMKDPRTGSWAVVGLVLLLLSKWIALKSVPLPFLMIPPVMGRLVMVFAAYHFPYARKSGLGIYFRDGLGLVQVLTATLIALIGIILVSQQMMLTVFVFSIGAATFIVIGNWAARRLGGGITGDVYGALCELTELFCLLGLSLWASV